MNVMVSNRVVRPDHVPEELVRDFDYFNIPGLVNGYSDDIHVLWKQVQDTYPDMFWTPYYGGHWVATRYNEMLQLTQDVDRFSNLEPFIPKGVIFNSGPSQMDAPDHNHFRKLVNLAFTPASLNNASTRARAEAAAIVERIRGQGRCNFMHDFAGVMPIVTFLNLLGLAESEQPYLLDLAERMVPGQPGFVEANQEASDYVVDLIAERERNPGDDFVSTLVRAQVMGRDLTPEERLNLIRLVVVGGLDTVINTTTFSMVYLARNLDVQRQIRENPAAHDGAVEEITRRFGTSNLARLVHRDCELGGVELKQGEQVMAVFPLSGLDERVNPDPMKFDVFRRGARHLNFGSGPHTCLGARLARREIRIFVEEWLAKMPEMRIAEGTSPRMACGLINTIRDVYLEWDPA